MRWPKAHRQAARVCGWGLFERKEWPATRTGTICDGLTVRFPASAPENFPLRRRRPRLPYSDKAEKPFGFTRVHWAVWSKSALKSLIPRHPSKLNTRVQFPSPAPSPENILSKRSDLLKFRAESVFWLERTSNISSNKTSNNRASMPDFLTRRNGSWHFARRVPTEFAHLDRRRSREAFDEDSDRVRPSGGSRVTRR